ncbi:MAG: hypothetical protein HYR88_15680 [Verrucomicrobia bacterium]|nr:hypothetical protein [Verrucomicrobiota bacterium]MBI3867741.1 hypothetical protein [Verrucomicrobiota bacterium]
MNPKRLALAVLAVFIAVFATDFFVHGVWLNGRYMETASLWRTEEEMAAHRVWLMGGQLLWSVIFVMLWAKGFASSACVRCAVMFGLFMALFHQSNTLIQYAVQPMPSDIAIKWVGAGAVQGMIAGLVAFFVYKPKACASCAPAKSE